MNGDLQEFIRSEIERAEIEAWVAAGELLGVTNSGDVEMRALDLYAECIVTRSLRENVTSDIFMLAMMIGPLEVAGNLLDDNPHRAIDFVMKSKFAIGYARGRALASKDARPQDLLQALRSELGKQGAAARHAENHEMKERIYEWWQANHSRFRSMDAAAEAYSRLEPISVRTARKHIGAAAKTYALPAKRTSRQ